MTNYYDKNAKDFFEATAYVDMSEAYARFHKHLPKSTGSRTHPGSIKIMDAGAGSGRDTKHFIDNGYLVYSFDNSIELCKLAEKNFDITVHCHSFGNSPMRFFSGIWACASLLHLPPKQLKYTMIRLASNLSEDGILYVSFKYGTFNGTRPDGRYYTDLTEAGLRKMLQLTDLIVLDEWVSKDVRPDRKNEKWLNAILTNQEMF